jgi:hypothetical protein
MSMGDKQTPPNANGRLKQTKPEQVAQHLKELQREAVAVGHCAAPERAPL